MIVGGVRSTTWTVFGLPPTGVPPIVTPMVGAPGVFGAVYVAVHTPSTHVKAPSVPALGVATKALGVAVTIGLPYRSKSLTVTVSVSPRATVSREMLSEEVTPEAPPPTVVGLGTAAVTVTGSRSDPVVAIVPSDTEMVAVSTLYRTIGTFVATPFTKVIPAVAAKLAADTVGCVVPFGATEAPLNVRSFAPV